MNFAQNRLFVTLEEGGTWIPIIPNEFELEFIMERGYAPGSHTAITAIRRGCVVYDFILRWEQACPWRYAEPLPDTYLIQS